MNLDLNDGLLTRKRKTVLQSHKKYVRKEYAMKKFFLYLTILFIAVSIIGFTPSNGGPKINRAVALENDVVANQLVIGYNSDADMETYSLIINEKYHLAPLERGYMGSFEVVQFADDNTLEDLMDKVSKEEGVSYAEPNHVFESSHVPNDPNFITYQWNLYNTNRTFKGQASNYVQSISLYGIKAEQAWDFFKPANINYNKYPGEGVKVAVIDTGIAYEDYTEIKNGKTITYKKAPDLSGTSFDTINAKNFTVFPNTSHANDDHSHGTHVCGTIAQTTNSTPAFGCAGIAYKATILPIKVLSANGSGSSSSVANGIYWAVDKGAKILNLSLGSRSSNSTIYNAVKYAYNKGAVIVCATGNDNSSVGYPAAYSECVAVGATDFKGAKCGFSNYGSTIDIVAPGQYIVQQTIVGSNNLTNFTFASYSGTSMATPHVAAAAALVWSLHPSYTRDQVTKALLSTARDLGNRGFDNYYGNGLLDAAAAATWTP